MIYYLITLIVGIAMGWSATRAWQINKEIEECVQ